MSADPVTEFEEYRNELLDRLGDRDPLEVMAETADRLEARLSAHGDKLLAARPADDAWSAKEIVGHLVDTEWVYGTRIRLMLSHDSPALPGYDQDLMVEGMVHSARPADDLLREFRGLREFNLALYRRSQGPAWERVGIHSERGSESVRLNIRLLAGHDLRHLSQVDRTLAALQE